MKTPPSVKILIVDDNSLYREVLADLLRSRPELNIIGEAEDGKSALEAVEKHRPDLVLMDLNMPVLNGIDAARAIKARFPDIKVVIMTIYDENPLLKEARNTDALECISKASSSQHILEAVLAAATC